MAEASGDTTARTVVCSKCGVECSPDDAFCPVCGKKMKRAWLPYAIALVCIPGVLFVLDRFGG